MDKLKDADFAEYGRTKNGGFDRRDGGGDGQTMTDKQSKSKRDGRFYGRRFLIYNNKLYAILWIVQILSYALRVIRPIKKPAKKIEKILLCNSAHIGDALIATAAISYVKENMPDVEIGFLTGSWSKKVFIDHPDVKHVYTFDNFFLNRSPVSFYTKIFQHFSTMIRTIREVRKAKYDAAIDLYFFWPNSIPLLWIAGIPRRIGFESGGFGPLLTDIHKWTHQPNAHMAEIQSVLLTSIGISAENLREPRTKLGKIPSELIHKTIGDKIQRDSYIILHPGTGAPSREWPVRHWIELADLLKDRGNNIVLTGQGIHEIEICEEIKKGVPECISLCNSLSFYEFRQVIQFSKMVIGVDSMACHLAAAHNTAYIVIFSGMATPNWTFPLGDGIVLTEPLPCSPCYMANGCDSIDCMKNLSAKTVFQAYQKLSSRESVGAVQI